MHAGLESEALPRWPEGRLYRFRDFSSFRKVLDLFTDSVGQNSGS